MDDITSRYMHSFEEERQHMRAKYTFIEKIGEGTYAYIER